MVIKGSIFHSYRIIENEMAFDVIRDPFHPNYIGYSFSESDQREIEYRTVTIMINQG